MNGARDDDRGQLILIAGIGIAVALVALALVLNSLVFTQYLATSPSPDGSEAIEYQHVVADGVRGLVSEANVRAYDRNVTAVVRNGTTSLSDLLGRQYGAHGTLVNVSVLSVESGMSIHQETVRPFTNVSGEEGINGSWTLFRGVNSDDSVRAFRMNVTSVEGANVSDPFTVTVWSEDNDGTTIEIYGDSSTIAINNADKPSQEQCTISSQSVTIDFSKGTIVNKSKCEDQLGGLDGNNFSKVVFGNGNSAKGKYVGVVNTDKTLGKVTNNFSRSPDRSPYAVPAIYATTLHATYAAPDVTYGTTVRVAPNAFGSGPDGDDGRYGVFSSFRSLVFVNRTTGNLSTIDPRTHVVTDYGIKGVQAIGAKVHDFDGDGVADIPYVNSSGTLKITDGVGSPHVLASGAMTSKTIVAVGTYRGETSVFYGNQTDESYIYRVGFESGNATEPRLVRFDGNGQAVHAPVGPIDYDGDGQIEFVYSTTSSTIKYIQKSNDTSTTGVSHLYSTGIGVGQVRVFPNRGQALVPIVKSNNIKLVKASGNTIDLTSGGSAISSPVAAIDWQGDHSYEIVYMENSPNYSLHYVTADGSTEPVRNANGTVVTAEQSTGVA